MRVLGIVLLAPLFFALPTGSNSLHHHLSQMPYIKSVSPGVRTQKDFPGILSYGPIFIDSINTGIRESKIFVQSPDEGSKSSQLGPNPSPSNVPFYSGSFSGSGLSSKEVFQIQGTDMAMAKAKEKEMEKYFQFLNNVKEGGKNGTQETGHLSPLKLVDRQKISSRPKIQSEEVGYVITEPSEIPNAASLSPITTGHGQQQEIREISPQTSQPGQKYIVCTKLIQQSIQPCNEKNATVVPQLQTTASPTDKASTQSNTGSTQELNVKEKNQTRTTEKEAETKISKKLRNLSDFTTAENIEPITTE